MPPNRKPRAGQGAGHLENSSQYTVNKPGPLRWQDQAWPRPSPAKVRTVARFLAPRRQRLASRRSQSPRRISNGAWAALPSKPVLDREGRRAKPDGKPQYAAIMKWIDRELKDRLSQAVIKLLRAAHSDVFEDGVA